MDHLFELQDAAISLMEPIFLLLLNWQQSVVLFVHLCHYLQQIINLQHLLLHYFSIPGRAQQIIYCV